MSRSLTSLFRRLPPLSAVERFKKDPVGVQETLLRRLLTTAGDTEWGRRYGFADLADKPDVVSAYQNAVPLQSYEDIRSDVERIRQGHADILWKGSMNNLAVSSGTASAGKLIPLSRDMLNANKAFSLAVGLNYLVESGNPRFIFGKHLTLPGRIEESAEYPGNMVGEVSGLQAEHAPRFFATLLQAVPNEMSFLPNWEDKLRTVADHTMDQDIRLVVMVPTWGLAFFDILKDRYAKRHGRSVGAVADIWPNLQIFISGGVALRSYHDLLDEAIGAERLDFVETYGASEGFFSFQDRLDDPSMLLHLDNGVFYEFVPMDRLGEPDPPRLSIRDVETDVRYALFVSTCSGLWSFGVGDVLRFTSTHPHRIVVAGRTSEMVDRFGEAVFGEEARAALRSACEQTGLHVRDFHVAPVLPTRTRNPSHQWLVEFEEDVVDTTRFAQLLDDHLQMVNRHYQIRRESRSFDLPMVTSLPKGGFYRWLKETRGSVSGQTKVPRMSEERDIADRVLDINGLTGRANE